MEFNTYIRKPFVVQASEITEENIHEVAKFVGTIRSRDDGEVFIEVDRTKIPNLDRVYVGFWVTKIGNNARCYSARVFTQQFVEMSDDARAWVDFLNQKEEPLPQPVEHRADAAL